jgi:uncharacterized protein (DUF433 family)
MSATDTPPAVSSHIVFDERGRPWIDDTNVKVIEVVIDHVEGGVGVEEMLETYPGLFTRAQLHAALMYFYDHEDEMRAEMQRLKEYVAQYPFSRPSPEMLARFEQFKASRR